MANGNISTDTSQIYKYPSFGNILAQYLAFYSTVPSSSSTSQNLGLSSSNSF